MTNKGRVVLIGAGPGDAGLITVKGAKLLSEAQVVVYDRLVSDEIMSLVPEKAELINVGKEANHHNIKQEEINQILLDKALEGKFVVRLKGGDPFVFGRGGEELELLADNGIPFEIVPGVTSAISALAYGGIPVTHRDYASSFHVITAHRKDGGLDIDFNALAALDGTIVFLMGVAGLPNIMDGLIRAGMREDTPAAIIENGTRKNQRKLVSTIGQIGKRAVEENIHSPSIIAVGKVCNLSDRFSWFN